MDDSLKAEIQTAVGNSVKNMVAAITAGKTPDLAKAYVKFWGEVQNVVKDAQNPHLKNDYATLEATLGVIKTCASANGLAFPQIPGVVREGTMGLHTLVVHTSGQVWPFLTELPFGEGTDKKTGLQKPATPQNAGSVITYARRYTLQALAGIAAVDDDGEAASVIEERTGEEGGTIDNGSVEVEIDALKAAMTHFKGKKVEPVKETLQRFKDQYEARVSATGSKPLVEEYIEHRKRLKAVNTKVEN